MYKNVEMTIIIFLMCLSILLLYCVNYLRFLKKNKQRHLKLDEFTITSSLDAEVIISKSLDVLINNTLTEFAYANIDCNPNFKFTPNVDSEITEIISNRIIENMSLIMFDKLSMIYRKDKIPEIIVNRVYLQVVPYIAAKKSELE